MEKVFFTLVAINLIGYMLMGCTISFQNISTNGTATDLVDQNQDAKANLNASVSTI
jgi:hypothetical protein